MKRSISFISERKQTRQVLLERKEKALITLSSIVDADITAGQETTPGAMRSCSLATGWSLWSRETVSTIRGRDNVLRGMVAVFRDVTEVRRKGEMQWVSRSHLADEEDQFELFYPVIAPLHSNAGEQGQQYELLIRMRDGNDAIISPGAFLISLSSS